MACKRVKEMDKVITEQKSTFQFSTVIAWSSKCTFNFMCAKIIKKISIFSKSVNTIDKRNQ